MIFRSVASCVTLAFLVASAMPNSSGALADSPSPQPASSLSPFTWTINVNPGLFKPAEPSAVPPSPPRPTPTLALPPPSAEPTKARLLQPEFGPLSHVPELFGGVWHCRTLGGNTLTHSFVHERGEPSIVAETRIPVTNGQFANIRESYAYNQTTAAWNITLGLTAVVASASDWSGTNWTFIGSAFENRKSIPFRMIFTRIDRTTFTRAFQRRDGENWATYAGETCKHDARL